VQTLERIKKLFLENFDFNEEVLKPEVTIESLGLDSLDKIEFLFALEQEFDIKIPDREVKIISIQDVVDVVERFTAEQRGKKP
jgi:acyl carrier protein